MGRMFRKLVPAIVAGALLALMTGGPAGAHADDNPPPQTSVANPTLSASCGLDFSVLLDRSGSVASSAADVTGAAEAFYASLADTGSKTSLASFATTASSDVAPLALTTGTNLTSLNTAVDGLSFGNFTNWEDGFVKASGQFAGYTGGSPDLLVVVTDGNPNYINSGSGTSGATEAVALAHAVTQADAIKAAGVHIFVIGVGDVNTSSLQAVSGSQQWTTGDFASADWTTVGSYSDLSTKLHDVATSLCNETVVVHKTVDGVAASGWSFAANASGDTQHEATNDDGNATFSWHSVSPVHATVTEAPRVGYELASVECTYDNEQAGSAIEDGVSLVVEPRSRIDCTFDNHKLTTGLSVIKTAVTQAHEGDDVVYSFLVTNIGEATLHNISVTDDQFGVIDDPIDSLTSGESVTLHHTLTVPADHTANIVNHATACGVIAVEHPQVCGTSSNHTLDVLHPAISIVKTANPLSVSGTGDVTYTYVVSNTGDIALNNIVVTDDVLGTIGELDTLAVDGVTTLTKTVTITPTSKTHNIGTVTALDPLRKQVSASDDALITIVEGTVVTPPTTTSTTAAKVDVLGETLSRTGTSSTKPLAAIGASILVFGLALAFGSRMRARSSQTEK